MPIVPTEVTPKPHPRDCKQCHHLPSGRIGYDGRQCFCACHDVADAAPELLKALKHLADWTSEADLSRATAQQATRYMEVIRGAVAAIAKAERTD